MAELKTKPTGASVQAFLKQIADPERRADCMKLAKLMEQAAKAKPKMWGASIVGFGEYHYKYATGREGDWFLVGFSPRKRDLTIYLMSGFVPIAKDLPALGKFKTGIACLYVKRLSDIDLKVLKRMVAGSAKALRDSGGACCAG